MISRYGPCRRLRAFTLIEVLAVLVIIMIVAALLLPAVQRSMVKARQTQCLGNLRQVGIAFHGFAHEHGGHFPMRVPIRQGGSMEANRQVLSNFPSLSFSPWHFKVMSNQLGATRIVICPADKRPAARSFPAMQATNISYWVNARAIPGNAVQFLSGDRNLISIMARTNRARAAAPDARFTRELHASKGNVLFGDGHVELLGVATGASLGDGGVRPPAVPGNSGKPTGAGPSAPGSTARERLDADPEDADENAAPEAAPVQPTDRSDSETPATESGENEDAAEEAREGGSTGRGRSGTSMTPLSTAARPPATAGSAAAPGKPTGLDLPSTGRGGTNQPALEPEGGRRLFDIAVLKQLAIGLYLLGLVLLILYLVHRYLNRQKRGKNPGGP